MLTWLLAILAGLALIAFIYPYAIYPLVLKRMPTVPVRCAPVERSMSLLFCAYNEADVIGAKIANLRELRSRHPDLQVFAFDDGSDDGTFEELSRANWIKTIKGAGRSGKAAGMKRLAAMARGEILVFTDANVMLAPDALDRLLPYYGDNSVGGVCGTLHYDSAPGSSMAEVGTAYWRLDEWLRSEEARTGNVMGADGSIFSIRRSLYPEFPDTVLDDFTVSMSVIFAGHRLINAADVNAFENSVSDRREELRRKARIGARAYHTHAYLRPQLRRMAAIDRFKYASRKTARWFGGLFMLAAVILSLGAVATLSLSLAVVACAALAVLAGLIVALPHGIIGKLGDIVLSILATLVGIMRGMRGQTVATWSPSKAR